MAYLVAVCDFREDLNKFPYLTMCLKESMRLNTTVPWINRQITKPTLIDGVMVAPGTLVQLDIYAFHHHPQNWQNPTVSVPSLNGGP